MKKLVLFSVAALALVSVSCGPGADEEAAKLKSQRERDSLREDSISNADAESMMQDMMPVSASGDSAKQDTVAGAK